ncbi:MAG: SurA N-terminal domain-containing protein, partial [Beijerinckiaceae bacterium]
MMMQGLRNAGQTWLGKLVVGVLFGLLILSFAIWGIADVFRGGSVAPVATVGATKISTEQMRSAYQTELQNLSRRLRRTVTTEQARSLGLDQQILGKLITEAAIDERIGQLGLAISDKTIADAIVNDPSFKGANGQFDRNLFAQTLRDNGYTEQRFVAEQRKVYLRQFFAEAMTGGLTAPLAMKEALHRLTYETRALEYVIVPAASIDPGQPDDVAVQAFFNERKAQFRAPEYRTVNYITLTADALAKPEAISE